MLTLPRGYYAIQNHYEEHDHSTFTYKGITYAVEAGINLFPSILEANAAATEIPDTVLEGLPYASFDTPVLLFSAGTHSIDKYVCDRNITVLGEHAGISPNLFKADRTEMPALNPLRTENETVVTGSYYHGNMLLSEESVSSVTFDGFTFAKARFRDLRKNGVKSTLRFANIIEKGPCGRMLFLMVPPKVDGTLEREVVLENIRVVDFDNCDHGGMFAQISANKVLIDGLCYVNTSEIFGFTTITRTAQNASGTAAVSEYRIQNSFFKDLGGENGISTGCLGAEDRGAHLIVEHSTFINASQENEGVLYPHLQNDLSALTVRDSIFCDTRNNLSAAIMIKGEGNCVTVENCTFEGFASEVDHLPSYTEAPKQIQNRDTAWVTETSDPHTVIGEQDADFTALDALYDGTKAYYGDLHVHTACGGRSDGKTPMSEWVPKMDAYGLDFAVVVDHRQMRGFFLPEWSEERFVIGTEPGTSISAGLNACVESSSVHYNMLFPHKYGLAMVLANFPEFEFRGDELNGQFTYPKFTKERFYELTAYVQSIGGMMVHPHPKDLLASHDPIDFYFGEHTYIETLYASYGSHCSFRNYKLWTDLLALGKHVYAAGGSDTHGDVSRIPFGVFYTKERLGRAFFDQMHKGDFAVGGVGLKMCVDGHPMGAEIPYRDGMTLTLRMDDFSKNVYKEDHVYELRVITDEGVAYASHFMGDGAQAVSLRVEKRKFYRAEVFDLTSGYFVTVGNPIWLE